MPECALIGAEWIKTLTGQWNDASGGYSKVWRETNQAIARLSHDERDRILGGTAISFYRLPVSVH